MPDARATRISAADLLFFLDLPPTEDGVRARSESSQTMIGRRGILRVASRGADATGGLGGVGPCSIALRCGSELFVDFAA